MTSVDVIQSEVTAIYVRPSTPNYTAAAAFLLNVGINHAHLFHGHTRSPYIYRCVYSGITSRNRTSAAIRVVSS